MAKTKTMMESENGDKATSLETTASSSGIAVTSDNDNISTRVGTRTKKAKVVFDPSDNYVPKKRVRKNDSVPLEPAMVTSPGRLDTLHVKSPIKLEKNTDSNGTTSGSKSRLTLSPTIAKQVVPNNYKPKVLGTGLSNDVGRSATFPSSPGSSTTPTIAQNQEYKRECDMCHKVEQQRRGFKLIDCCNCAFRAHSKCLRAHSVYSKFPIQLNFRCFQCIECVVCGKTLRGGNLLFCCDCQNAFHKNCHGPSASDSNPNAPWICNRCTGEKTPIAESRSQEKQRVPPRPETVDTVDDEAHQDFAGFSDNEIKKDSFSIAEGAADESEAQTVLKQEETEDVKPANAVNEEEKFDTRLDNFENIQDWSCDDVYRYFKRYFPDYAYLFKEQEIDGPSLVLMRKSDVLSGFGLKLGPAITLYQRIVMMQNNDRDFRLTWI